MLLISAGIKRVVAEYKYHAGSDSEAMLKQAGVTVEYIHDETLSY
jgi:dCMP deaminase